MFRRHMTIVFLAPRFYPEIGGVEKHAFEVAKELSKKHKVIVITEGDKERKEKVKKIKVVRLYFGKNNWFKKFIIWRKILGLRALISKADIIHCHDVFFWYLPMRIIYPRKKVYITFHGYETIFPPRTSAIFIRKLSEKLSNGNIAIGKYIEKWYGTSSENILYGGHDFQKEMKSRKVNKNNPRVLFIGRIEKDNGIEIYSNLLNQLKNFRFDALGDGSLRKEFEKFGEVHGFVKDVRKYLRRCDIVLSSSYLSIIESLSFKKPVFSAYENLLKEDYLKLSPFSKWIYISKSPKIMLAQIKSVLKNDKLRDKNSKLAYNWVEGETWKKVTDNYLRLWNK